jgi:hypothetical protein
VRAGDLEDPSGVLRDVLLWRLAPRGWDEVDIHVTAMAQALAGGDDDGFQRAAAELELAGPVRVASAEDPPSEPPGPRVRERISRLIFVLGAARPEPDDQRDAEPDADVAG